MLAKVRRYIEEYQMLAPGERVVVACSGGADSICLLSVLQALGMQVLAVHVHHGLRGIEADRDADFVRDFCAAGDIACRVVRLDVAGYASGHGMSVEEAGRALRYQSLEAAADEWGACKIAVAHHEDDNAETILHHLLRGTGLRGLGGIRPVQGSRIRPLLCVSRKEIESYLEERGILWCEDSTNRSNDYTRNRIRNQVLPFLEETVNPKAVQNILNSGEAAAQADEYLVLVADGLWKQYGSFDNKCARFPVMALKEQPPILRRYLIGKMVSLTVPGRRDITSVHYGQMERLAWGKTGSEICLPGGIVAVREPDSLVLSGTVEAVLPPEPVFEKFPYENHGEIPKNRYTKWFDYDKIKGTLCVRTRQSGDFLSLPEGKTKTVSRYMIDEKIPRRQREQIYLLADGKHIVWIVGYRISEYYKITNDTKMILQVTVHGGENHGR